MPDLVTHIWFCQQVAAELPGDIREKTGHDLFPYAAAGPDVWFPCGFYGTRDKVLAPRGGHMHENETGAFLTALCRTRVGDVRIEDCVTLDGFQEWLDRQEIEQ